MEMLVGFFIAWLIFCFVFAEIGPLIGMLIVYLVQFVAVCTWVTISTILKLLLLTITLPLRLLWFLLCVPFRRLRRVDPWEEMDEEFEPEFEDNFEQEHEARFEEEEPEPEQKAKAPFRTPYEAACWFLGLEPNSFDKATFKKAYRSAIRTAHPDAGGDLEHAQTINRSADIIRAAHGW